MSVACGATPAQAEQKKWSPHLDVTGVLGDRERGEVDLFVPVLQDRTGMLFADLRGKLFTQGELEGNFGLGYREMLRNGWNLGGYAFYDLRRTERNNTFRQVTFGAEALSVDWDYRANIYVPLTDGKDIGGPAPTGSSTVVASPGSVVLRTPFGQAEEIALHGIDGEIGRRIPIFEEGDDRQFRIFVGGYYFDEEDLREELAGPRGRLEYRVHNLPGLGAGSRLTFEGRGQWDDPRGFQGFVGATLRIPLQKPDPTLRRSRLTPIERRMTDPIVRDVDIVTRERIERRGTVSEPAIIAETGVRAAGVRTAAAGDDLSDVVENQAAPNEIVVVDGALTDSVVTMQTGQALVGGGTRVRLVGADTGVRTAWLAPGSPGSVDLSGSDLNVPSNALVAGLTLANADEAVDLDNGASNVRIRDLTIDSPGDDGIELANNQNVRISNVSIDNAGERGIDMDNSTGVTIQDVTISDTQSFEGLDGTGSADVVIRRLRVVNTLNDDAIEFDNIDGLVLTDTTVIGADNEGLDIDVGTDVTVRDLTIDTTNDNGMELEAITNLRMSDTTVSNAANDGISINEPGDTSTNLNFDNVTVRDVGDDGFDLNGTIDGLSGSGNTATNVGDDACSPGAATVTNSSLVLNGAPCP